MTRREQFEQMAKSAAMTVVTLSIELQNCKAIERDFWCKAINNAVQLSNSLTNIGVMLGLAREVNQVDLDMITFIKLPVYSMKGAYSGRVGLIEDQGQFLFDKIAKDEPLILAKANFGQGAVVAEDDNTQTNTSTTDATAAATESEPVETLPEWVQGTKASVKSCSK